MPAISAADKKRIAEDPWLSRCCVCKKEPVEIHHAITGLGHSVKEFSGLVALCLGHHRGGKDLNGIVVSPGSIAPDVKEWCELMAILRDYADLEKNHPKTDWSQRKQYLVNKYILRPGFNNTYEART